MKRRVTDSAAALARHLSMPQPPLAAPADPAGLEICPVCTRDFVNPIDWAPLSGDRWWMLLRCGDCGAAREVTADADTANAFDGELNRRLAAVAETADQLDLERMAAEVETAHSGAAPRSHRRGRLRALNRALRP